MTTIFAIANQKGGVGKTTTAATLAHGTALAGLSTVVIDLDPQSNVAYSYGLPSGGELAKLLDIGQFCPAPTGRAGLGVIRSDRSTVGAANTLAAMGDAHALAEALEGRAVDVIFLDCPPSVNILHVAALVAADWLIIPTRLDQFSIQGVQDILTSLASTQRRGSRCQLAGVLPTFWESTTTESQTQLQNLAQHFAGLVLPPIPADTKIRTANRAGQTLYEFAPKCRALVKGYALVLARVLGLMGITQ